MTDDPTFTPGHRVRTVFGGTRTVGEQRGGMALCRNGFCCPLVVLVSELRNGKKDTRVRMGMQSPAVQHSFIRGVPG
jgi:hypothetical protein